MAESFPLFFALLVLALVPSFPCCEVVNTQSDIFVFAKARCGCSFSTHWPFHVAFLSIWKRALLICQHKLPFVLPILSGMVSGVRKWYQWKGVIILEYGWIVHPWSCPGCLTCPVPPQLSSYLSHVFSFPHTHPIKWLCTLNSPV